jgi:hypothetical protein
MKRQTTEKKMAAMIARACELGVVSIDARAFIVKGDLKLRFFLADFINMPDVEISLASLIEKRYPARKKAKTVRGNK